MGLRIEEPDEHEQIGPDDLAFQLFIPNDSIGRHDLSVPEGIGDMMVEFKKTLDRRDQNEMYFYEVVFECIHPDYIENGGYDPDDVKEDVVYLASTRELTDEQVAKLALQNHGAHKSPADDDIKAHAAK